MRVCYWHGMHADACMPSVTVRNVPPETRDELAARAGRSLQEYLRAELIELARRSDQAELMERIRQRVRSSDSDMSVE